MNKTSNASDGLLSKYENNKKLNFISVINQISTKDCEIKMILKSKKSKADKHVRLMDG